MRTLALLSESLPLALKQVPHENIQVQLNFWREFIEFDRRTDVSQSSLDEDWAMSMALAIEDWRQVVELRVNQGNYIHEYS